MANKSRIIHNKKAWIFLLIVLAFVAGFLVARARYKPQIQSTFDMVMEREQTISDLNLKITELENKMRLEEITF